MVPASHTVSGQLVMRYSRAAGRRVCFVWVVTSQSAWQMGDLAVAVYEGAPRYDTRLRVLQDIVHLHGAIRAALHGFAGDIRRLQSSADGVDSTQLAALVERHRFLRAVCTFHAASEDEVLFPAAR